MKAWLLLKLLQCNCLKFCNAWFRYSKNSICYCNLEYSMQILFWILWRIPEILCNLWSSMVIISQPMWTSDRFLRFTRRVVPEYELWMRGWFWTGVVSCRFFFELNRVDLRLKSTQTMYTACTVNWKYFIKYSIQKTSIKIIWKSFTVEILDYSKNLRNISFDIKTISNYNFLSDVHRVFFTSSLKFIFHSSHSSLTTSKHTTSKTT